MGLSLPMPWESMPLLSEAISTSAHISASASGTPAAVKTSTIKRSMVSKSTQYFASDIIHHLLHFSLILMLLFHNSFYCVRKKRQPFQYPLYHHVPVAPFMGSRAFLIVVIIP